MKTKVWFPNHGFIEATMEITMTIKEWAELASQLNKAWPGWNLTPHIRELIAKAQTNFEATPELDA